MAGSSDTNKCEPSRCLAVFWGIVVTIVRIVLADPRSGRVPAGSAVNGQQLIVLADDTGHRAVPLWLGVVGAKLLLALLALLERPAGDAVMAGVLEETAARLLHAAGVTVTAVDIEPAGEDVPELRSDTAAARVELAMAAGTRHVVVSAGYGLKLAVAAGAPVRVADAVMDRLLGDWPENLHPASAHGLPSAEDLDRADALGRAVAGLPSGQRQAITLFYYADQPASQIAATPGAAKASLHKARRRLREYITAHRPDLIPVTSRSTPMTAVRIAHAEPWPGRQPVGLVVLADDAGHRALPVRLPGRSGVFWRLFARPEDRDGEYPEDDAGEMTGQLLRAAGIAVTAVTVTDLGPGVTATRIDIAAPGGTRQMTARLADGLALAVITGTPLAVDDPVMDRLAQPVTGPGLLSPFRSRQQAPRALREHSVRAAQPDVRRRPAPMAARRHLPAPGHRVPRPGLFLHHRRQACDPDRGRARTRRIRLPQPGDQRRRLPRPRRRLPRRPALHRRRRPRRTGAPHHPRRTATSRTGSLARSRQPLRLRHRNPRLGPA